MPGFITLVATAVNREQLIPTLCWSGAAQPPVAVTMARSRGALGTLIGSLHRCGVGVSCSRCADARPDRAIFGTAKICASPKYENCGIPFAGDCPVHTITQRFSGFAMKSAVYCSVFSIAPAILRDRWHRIQRLEEADTGGVGVRK